MIEPGTGSHAEVFDALRRGATVITATRRLAGTIHSLFDSEEATAGSATWRTPDLRPWHQWVNDTWEAALLSGAVSSPRHLLTQEQELHLWERIVTERLADQPLQQIGGTVREAEEAWQLLHAWRLPLDPGAFRYNRDSMVFCAWAAEFDARCAKAGWLSRAAVADELRYAFEAGALASPRELLLLGFDELTPQQQALLGALRERGSEVSWLEPPKRAADARRVECADARAECEVMARWVRACLEREPGATIGVVVPDLQKQRHAVSQALDRVLIPGAIAPGAGSHPRPYNVSLGPPLAHYPIVACAFTLLRMLQPAVAIDDAGVLLRSPFLAGWPAEAGARALLDRQLRETGEPLTTLARIRYLAALEERPSSAPLLAVHLGRWIETTRLLPDSATADEWAARFAELLDAIGWGGGRPLDSDEYQTVEAWHQLLASLSSLQPVAASASAAGATATLRQMAMARAFQPRTDPQRVQVLGMLEAMGLQFDHLWVMGLEDTSWPPAPRPNPFIPLPLQREASLPRSSEQRELGVSRQITGRLLGSADDVIVSSPQRRNDEVLRPSPLVGGLAVVPRDALPLWTGPDWCERIRAGGRVERVEPDPAPPVPPGPARGGSHLFRLQAACPFRAFGEVRLGAEPIGDSEIGLAPTLRGSLVHGVLERVWRELRSQRQLQEMDPSDLAALVHEAVDDTLAGFAARYRHALAGRMRALERERLAGQTLEWLDLEMRRPPFEVIAREHEAAASAGGIDCALRIDRIDRLDDGRQLLIDYKTGDVSPAEWFGDRPEDPQLPLYSIAVDGPVAALLFAQVKAGRIAFNGVAADAELVPGVKSFRELRHSRDRDSWGELLREWRETLERLGHAFRAGDAEVDPKRFPGSCNYCRLAPLCRIDEINDRAPRSDLASAAEEPP